MVQRLQLLQQFEDRPLRSPICPTVGVISWRMPDVMSLGGIT